MGRIAEQFDGATYGEKRDGAALNAQLDYVRAFMSRNRGHYTLDELAETIFGVTGVRPSTASISARLRDLRKAKFGGYTMKRRIRAGTKRLWEYHLDFPQPQRRAA